MNCSGHVAGEQRNSNPGGWSRWTYADHQRSCKVNCRKSERWSFTLHLGSGGGCGALKGSPVILSEKRVNLGLIAREGFSNVSYIKKCALQRTKSLKESD